VYRPFSVTQKQAFEDALIQAGSPDTQIDLVCITSPCPRQFLPITRIIGSNRVAWPRMGELPSAIGASGQQILKRLASRSNLFKEAKARQNRRFVHDGRRISGI
jgi:hypothetical protein